MIIITIIIIIIIITVRGSYHLSFIISTSVMAADCEGEGRAIIAVVVVVLEVSDGGE